MTSSAHHISIAFILIALPICATAETPSTSESQDEPLTEFVRTKWALPSFQLGKHTVQTVVPVRVSTWSGAPFIHRGQNEKLASYENDLSGFCSRQNGQWIYKGLPVVAKAPRPQNPMLAQAVANAPPTEQGLRDVIRIGEQAIALDVWKAMVEAVRDPLGREAVEFAAKQKWLGQFECKRDAESWVAQISANDVKTRYEHNLIYKDVSMKVELNAAP